MKVRVPMGKGLRAKMIIYGALGFVVCVWLWPHVTTEAAKTFLTVGLFMGPLAILGGIIGVQDHSL